MIIVSGQCYYNSSGGVKAAYFNIVDVWTPTMLRLTKETFAWVMLIKLRRRLYNIIIRFLESGEFGHYNMSGVQTLLFQQGCCTDDDYYKFPSVLFGSVCKTSLVSGQCDYNVKLLSG